MKNVLMPTDLTVQSLRPVHDIVKGAKGEPVTVFIAHLICPPGSITELLFINQNKPFRDVPQNFKEALQLLRNKYEGRLTIQFDFVYCNSSRYFNNFIEGNRIDEVYMLTNYKYRQTLPQSEDPAPYLNKCKAAMYKIGLHPEASSEYQNLSALLNGAEQIKAPELYRSGKTTVSYS
jgi:hypothetical protein